MPLPDATLPIRIVLANHQPIVRSGLRLLLERESDFRVVAEAANGQEAISLVEYSHPDVALLEIRCPHLNGIAVAREISSRAGRSKPVFVTAHTDEGYVNEAFKAGARGYVAGDSATTDLPRAIRIVACGGLFLSRAICELLFDKDLQAGNITAYGKDLCCLSAAGYDDDEIALALKTNVEKIRGDRLGLKPLFLGNTFPEALSQCVFTKECALESS